MNQGWFSGVSLGFRGTTCWVTSVSKFLAYPKLNCKCLESIKWLILFDLALREAENIPMSILNSSKLRHRISSEGNLSRKRTRVSLLAVALGLTATVVASPPSAPVAAKPGTPSAKPTASPKHHWFEIGKASWYGGSFNGRKTADGERFDMNALTCAHRSLPLGSWVRVTNLHNKKAVLLRVNDRGPMAESLIVDLSYAAAQKLGINGLGSVKIEKVSLNDEKMAEALEASLKPIGPPEWSMAEGLGR